MAQLQGRSASAPEGKEELVPTPADQLALNVLELARTVIVSENQFLAAPVSQLQLRPFELKGPLGYATEGSSVYFRTAQVLKEFQASTKAPTHDFLHMVMHFILLHPFVGEELDRSSWSLAADISSEALVSEVLGPRPGERGEDMEAVFNLLYEDFQGKLTGERLYRSLRKGAYKDDFQAWTRLFAIDDHSLWYPEEDSQLNQSSKGTSGKSGAAGSGQKPGSLAGQGEVGSQSGDDSRKAAEAAEIGDKSEAAGASRQESEPARRQEGAEPHPDGASSLPARLSSSQLEDIEKIWNKAAKTMKVDLETLSRKRGLRMGQLMRELEVSQHEVVDYREFLRQFAINSEDMHLSDDEFDYIFYTYGLQLYGDMPLIEPLEYRSENKVRDFVIVIDTSSSVTGKIVQQFIDATFDVLTSQESFAEQVNIHIIQCDAQVRSDTKITSLAELDRWRRNIKLYGFGGTDFRPAFKYINELYHSGEFDDLGGVIYFTDGWGLYPDRKPPYKCAFCFYDEDHRPELVPSWAIQLTLHPGQFESMSVY